MTSSARAVSIPSWFDYNVLVADPRGVREESFNPILVRLQLAPLRNTRVCRTGFQSHLGSITTGPRPSKNRAKNRFQSHLGSITTE